MSLGQLVSSPTFMEDTIVAKSSSQKRSNLTLSHSLKCSDCKSSTAIISSGFNAINHRGLRRIASDNSFLTRAAPTKSYDTTWISTSFGDYNNDKELSLTTNVQQTVNVRLKQHNNFFNGQTYKLDPGLRYSSYREKSNTAVMKNISSSGPETTERVTNSRLEKSHTYNAALHSGELLLDFPSNDYSSQSYTVKRSDKIREPSDHPSLHHSASMPGLIGSSMKESRSDFASAKFESKSRPSFLFFRKNNKTSDGRSPSPSVKSNHKNIKRHHGNLNSTPQSQTISQRTTSPTSRGRRSAGQSSVSIRFYINSVSSNVPCSPSSPPSMCSQSETRSSSPTSTDKFPLYTKRSRSKRGRESRRTISEHPHADDRLKLEDLPPHPSLFKHLLGKTSSYPCASVITPSSIKINTISNNTAGHRFEAMYAIRRNSLPESHANLKMADQFSKRHNSPKDFKIDSSQNLRKNSPESSNKSTSGKDFQPEMTCSSHCQKPRSPVRSESVSILGDNFYLSGTDTMVISDAEDFEYRPTDMTGPLHVSLCGCGFLGMYHLGVISCLTQRSPSLLERLEKVAGASAGAIMAALLISCRDKIEESAEHIQNLAKEIRKKPLGPLTPGYNFTRSLRCMLDDVLPENAHETTRGKLFVSVTNSDTKKNEMLFDFVSRDELIEALVSSCYLPVYAGIKPGTVRGKKYIDGGLSNNMPIFETGRTITVSPFDVETDIGPKAGQEAEKKGNVINIQNQDIQISVNNARKCTQAFFPPKRQLLEEYFEKGRYDTNRFLIREGLYEITTAAEKKVILYESSV